MLLWLRRLQLLLSLPLLPRLLPLRWLRLDLWHLLDLSGLLGLSGLSLPSDLRFRLHLWHLWLRLLQPLQWHLSVLLLLPHHLRPLLQLLPLLRWLQPLLLLQPHLWLPLLPLLQRLRRLRLGLSDLWLHSLPLLR